MDTKVVFAINPADRRPYFRYYYVLLEKESPS